MSDELKKLVDTLDDPNTPENVKDLIKAGIPVDKALDWNAIGVSGIMVQALLSWSSHQPDVKAMLDKFADDVLQIVAEYHESDDQQPDGGAE